MIVSVVIDIKHQEVNRTFDYIVPKELESKIKKGMRVSVPFGLGDNIRLALVANIKESSDLAEKEIYEILDEEPILTDLALDLYNHLYKDNDLMFEVIETIMPTDVWGSYRKEATLLINKKLASKDLNEIFKNRNKYIYTSKTSNKYKRVLKEAYENGIVYIESVYKPTSSIKKDDYLYPNYNKPLDNYYDLMLEVLDNPGVKRIDLINKGYSRSSINTLIKRDLFKVQVRREYRKYILPFDEELKKHELNEDQKKVSSKIIENLTSNKIHFINGVTGSGKTESYFKVMEEVLKEKRQILYLVPQISLVPQMLSRLENHFKEDVLIFHSGLNKGVRGDAIEQVKKDKPLILLGTRSSVFLPFNNLGLIVLDEAHDDLYIQDDHINYDTKEIIDIIRNKLDIPVIYGTATPTVEQYYNIKNRQYNYYELNKRVSNLSLPNLYIEDMRAELKEGNFSILSRNLKSLINKKLAKEEQVMLLFNRKGYAPFSMCRTCGHVPNCPSCDIALTYFKDDESLRCRYCNYKKDYERICENCGSNSMKLVGVGIEYIKDQLTKIFPNKIVVQMDQTTTSKKDDYANIYSAMKDKEIDILIGTDMIAKGLDFPNVTLVGVIMADMLFNVPHYLATEEAYILLKQIIGRSGRKVVGDAVIQTYEPDHYVIKSLKKDRDYFYKEALRLRRVSKYEPYYHNAQILVTGKSYFETYKYAYYIREKIKPLFESVLGPTEAMIKKIRDEFRFIITIKNQDIISAEFLNELTKNADVKVKYVSKILYV